MSMKMNKDEILKAYKVWAFDPYSWVKAIVKPDFITKQQRTYLVELGKLARAKYKKKCGAYMSEKERLYSDKSGISVRSGKGRGKDALLSWTVLWLLDCYPGVKIPITAPSETQLKTIVWTETEKWLNRFNNERYICPVRDKFSITGERINVKVGKDTAGFAFMKTAQAGGSAKSMSGFHAEYMGILVTEADGTDEMVLRELESTLTSPFNFMIMIFNPTRSSGFAAKTHLDSKESKNWINIHFDDTPNRLVTYEYLQKKREQWGVDSNYYRIYCSGEFPVADDNAIIPREWIMEAVDRPIPETAYMKGVMGTDPAGEGKDSFETCLREGYEIKEFFSSRFSRDEEIVDDLVSYARRKSVRKWVILKNGAGIGVFREAKKTFKDGIVRGFYEQNRAVRSDLYFNKKAELWDKARKLFQNGEISIPNDEEFIEELSAHRWEPDIKLKRVISKKILRKLIGHSPGKADSFIACLDSNIETELPRTNFMGKRNKYRKRKLGWMAR